MLFVGLLLAFGFIVYLAVCRLTFGIAVRDGVVFLIFVVLWICAVFFKDGWWLVWCFSLLLVILYVFVCYCCWFSWVICLSYIYLILRLGVVIFGWCL